MKIYRQTTTLHKTLIAVFGLLFYCLFLHSGLNLLLDSEVK